MAHTVLPYLTDPTPLGETRVSQAWRIPDEAFYICGYLIASQTQYSSSQWEWNIALDVSEDGTSWLNSLPQRATGDVDSIAPHAADMDPGDIPQGTEFFELVRNSGMSMCWPRQSWNWARLRISCQYAPAGVSAAYIAGCFAARDNTLEIDYPMDPSLVLP